MSKLEATILQVATEDLRVLRFMADDPATLENQSSFFSQWHKILGLTYLGHLAESGLTSAAAEELERIERETNEVRTEYVEKNGIGQTKH